MHGHYPQRSASQVSSPSLSTRQAHYPVGLQSCTPQMAAELAAVARTREVADITATTTSSTSRAAWRPSNKRRGQRAPPPVKEAPLDVSLGGSRESVRIGGHWFRLLEPLGHGSFGVVWRADGQGYGEVAIKEIICKSNADLQRASFEVNILQSLNYAIHRNDDDSSSSMSRRLPALVLADVEGAGNNVMRVRLAMTRVPGSPLEQFMEERRKQVACWDCRQQFLSAGKYATNLLEQLAPTIEQFSTFMYHRDVTPRNILVDVLNSDGDEPRFGLVDFGLAVDAVQWRSDDRVSNDLGGDGHYWPASAWYVFGHGTKALAAHHALRHEYSTSLDVHALGLSALRCLMELTPALQDLNGPLAFEYDEPVFPKLRALHKAWVRYWSNARRFWQPVFNFFKHGGDFNALKASYVRAGVHRIVSADLCALRTSMVEVSEACQHAPGELGLAGLPALFDAMLSMICSGQNEESEFDRRGERAAAFVNRRESCARESPSLSSHDTYGRGRSPDRKTCDLSPSSSRSTGTPDSSPSCASSQDYARPREIPSAAR